MLRLINEISRISILIILLGYINLYFYYFFYGLEIYNFLDTTEIIFSFSSLIPTSLVLISMFTFGEFFRYLNKEEEEARMKKIMEEVEKKKKEKEEKSESEKVNRQFRFHIKSNILRKALIGIIAVVLTFISQFFFLLIFALLAGLEVTSSSWNSIFELSFAIFLMIVYTFSRRQANKQKLYFGMTVLFALFLVIRSNAAHNAVIKGNPKYSVEIQMLDGQIMKSNDSLTYIGSTKQYHFFHNIKSKENSIIPNSTVKEIKLKELRGGV